MNTQQVASIVRQVVAVAAIVMGALTSALSGIKLPPAVSAVLTAAGAGLLWIEHYVGDPSTGTTPTSSPPTPPAAVVVPPPNAPPAHTSLPTFSG